MTDFRALCAELLQGLDENRHPEVRYPGHLRIIMDRARTRLARRGHHPVPPAEGEVGDDQIEAEFLAWFKDTYGHRYYGAIPLVVLIPWTRHKAALDRSRRAVQPADGEVGELVAWLKAQALAFHRVEDYVYEKRADRAADLLAQRHPAPVPVSEKPWERPGWCDKRGRCWWSAGNVVTGAEIGFSAQTPTNWWLVSAPKSCISGVMLPFDAIPSFDLSDETGGEQ